MVCHLVDPVHLQVFGLFSSRVQLLREARIGSMLLKYICHEAGWSASLSQVLTARSELPEPGLPFCRACFCVIMRMGPAYALPCVTLESLKICFEFYMYFALLGYLTKSFTASTAILSCTQRLGSLLRCKPLSMNNICCCHMHMWHYM